MRMKGKTIITVSLLPNAEFWVCCRLIDLLLSGRINDFFLDNIIKGFFKIEKGCKKNCSNVPFAFHPITLCYHV